MRLQSRHPRLNTAAFEAFIHRRGGAASAAAGRARGRTTGEPQALRRQQRQHAHLDRDSSAGAQALRRRVHARAEGHTVRDPEPNPYFPRLKQLPKVSLARWLGGVRVDHHHPSLLKEVAGLCQAAPRRVLGGLLGGALGADASEFAVTLLIDFAVDAVEPTTTPSVTFASVRGFGRLFADLA